MSTQQELEWALLGCQQEIEELRASNARLRAQINVAREVINLFVQSLTNGTLNAVLVVAANHGVNAPDAALTALAQSAVAWLAANLEVKA